MTRHNLFFVSSSTDTICFSSAHLRPAASNIHALPPSHIIRSCQKVIIHPARDQHDLYDAVQIKNQLLNTWVQWDKHTQDIEAYLFLAFLSHGQLSAHCLDQAALHSTFLSASNELNVMIYDSAAWRTGSSYHRLSF